MYLLKLSQVISDFPKPATLLMTSCRSSSLKLYRRCSTIFFKSSMLSAPFFSKSTSWNMASLPSLLNGLPCISSIVPVSEWGGWGKAQNQPTRHWGRWQCLRGPHRQFYTSCRSPECGQCWGCLRCHTACGHRSRVRTSRRTHRYATWRRWGSAWRYPWGTGSSCPSRLGPSWWWPY